MNQMCSCAKIIRYICNISEDECDGYQTINPSDQSQPDQKVITIQPNTFFNGHVNNVISLVDTDYNFSDDSDGSTDEEYNYRGSPSNKSYQTFQRDANIHSPISSDQSWENISNDSM